MDDKFDDAGIPLAQSSVTLQLEQIQRRCGQLLEDDSGISELSLEEPVDTPEASNPYNRG